MQYIYSVLLTPSTVFRLEAIKKQKYIPSSISRSYQLIFNANWTFGKRSVYFCTTSLSVFESIGATRTELQETICCYSDLCHPDLINLGLAECRIFVS